MGSNHLDLFSKEMLLEALRSFPGTVVFVSHDRHFIDGLATRVVEVEGGSLTSYPGDYEYFLAKKEGAVSSAPAPSLEPRALSDEPASKDERLRGREEEKQRQKEERSRQKRIAEIESAIEKCETTLQTVEAKLVDPLLASDYEALSNLGAEHSALQEELERLYGEWGEVQG